MRTRIQNTRRRIRRTILVICEGETESVYIKALARQYRLPVTIRTRVSGTSINSRVVSNYLRELALSDKNEYRIFYVYDGDVQQIVQRLSQLEGTPIITTPCIELWFMLHLQDYRRFTSSETIVNELTTAHPVWRTYKKGSLSSEQQKILMENRSIAAMRADKLTRHSNPSSDMPDFIRALENEK